MTPATNAPARERCVRVLADGRLLDGLLTVPADAAGVVLFAHGSGSGRLSPRNQFVARALQLQGFATLLLDLLDEQEAADADYVFDVKLLAGRLEAAADWLRCEPETDLPLGLFGASTGAAAALVTAAQRPLSVGAVVSRGGRPDLAAPHLHAVRAPTLLIVGGADRDVYQRNEQALQRLGGIGELAVIPGATHLFPEPGALEEVARLAADWFGRYLAKPG